MDNLNAGILGAISVAVPPLDIMQALRNLLSPLSGNSNSIQDTLVCPIIVAFKSRQVLNGP